MSQGKIVASTVKKVASLAKIKVAEDQLDKFASQLESILDHASDLQKLDTSSVKATDIIQTCTIDELREDEEWGDQDEIDRIRQNIIKAFYNSQNNFLVLPVKVIE